MTLTEKFHREAVSLMKEKGEFAKAFLIGEGFAIKKEDWLEAKAVFKVSY